MEASCIRIWANSKLPIAIRQWLTAISCWIDNCRSRRSLVAIGPEALRHASVRVRLCFWPKANRQLPIAMLLLTCPMLRLSETGKRAEGPILPVPLPPGRRAWETKQNSPQSATPRWRDGVSVGCLVLASRRGSVCDGWFIQL